MTDGLPWRNAIEQQQVSPYRMDRVRGETLESLKYRCKGGQAQRQMVEVIFNYFADQHNLLDAVDAELPDNKGGKIDILVQCPDPMLSAPVLVAVEVDGPDHLKKDKYQRQTITDSERFIHSVIYPFHVTNEEANRRPKKALRRLLDFINNVFWLRYLTRYEYWRSMEPAEPDFLSVPRPQPVQVEEQKQTYGEAPVTTNGHTDTDETDEDDELPF